MKFDYETENNAKMSSKKKKSNAKSKPTDAVFSETRPTGQVGGKNDGDSHGGYSSSGAHEMASFPERERFSDGSWPKDGYGKMTNLGAPPHFNNFNPGFSNMVPYPRNSEDGESMRVVRDEHYPGYDAGKSGFINNPNIGRHGSDSQLGMIPPRQNFPGASGPGMTHGYGTSPASGFMSHGQTPVMQQTYPTATPMLTQLLRYPNPGEKYPPGQVDEYRASGPSKSWMDNVAPGMNQNVYPPRPTMPFYDQRSTPHMNQAHSNQIPAPPPPHGAAPLHGNQGQPPPSGSGNLSNAGIFAPPPYIQSCNPPVTQQRVDGNEKCAPLLQQQQRSSSQPRPISSTSSGPSSLGSPNHIRPISPVPTSMPPHGGGHQTEKLGSSAQKTSSSACSKPKKRREELNNIQDISSCDEGGSDSSSSTEVYSQITPMSTPSTTPLPPQSAGGTKPSPQGSDESPSSTPAPGIGLAMAPSSSSGPGGVAPPPQLGGAAVGGPSSMTGGASLPGNAQPSESPHGGQGQGPSGPGIAGNYSRSPGAQQLYRPQGHLNQYGGPGQMYGSAGGGPPGMHPNQPCGNYPYPGQNKVASGQYMHGHSQGPMPPGMLHPMELENSGSGSSGKGYGMPGGMYGPGKMGVQPAPGSMVNANMQGLHYHQPGMNQSNPPHPGQFGKGGYGTPFNAGPGNGVGPPGHHQHMGPYPGAPFVSHVPPPPSNQMQYPQRPMMSPVPHGSSGSALGEHGNLRPASPAFYRGGPAAGYESDTPGGPGNSSGRSQWVMNMQGMSGGSVVEAPRGENIPMEMPPVTIPSGGEIQRIRNPAFDLQVAKDRMSASPISTSDYTSAESKSGDLTMVTKQIEPPKMENDFSNASATTDSHGRGMMSPVPSKSSELDSAKKDIGSDSNSLPGQDRLRIDSDKQETLSSPPSTPFNHITSSPASMERDISSPSVHSSKSSGSSSVFSKIADMGNEHDRGIFLERLFSFMSYRGSPITAVPVICKQTVDLYRLYHLVRERGGMVEVTKNKKWREVSTALNLGASSSAGFTLKRNYAKFLFPFECRYDRGNIDPAPIIASMEMSTKKDSKKNAERSGDLDNCRPPSNQSFSGYPVPGPMQHGMPMPDMPGRGMHQGMMGPSPSPYNGGMAPGAMGRAGMMSPVGMVQNHSSMPRSSADNLPSNQDSVSIQDPFHDVSGAPGQYPPAPGNMTSQMPMYGSMTEHGPSAAISGPYEHRPNMAAGGIPPMQSASAPYMGTPNQCMPSTMTGPGNQGNGFGEMCTSGRGRAMNDTGFGGHAIHGNEYNSGNAASSGYCTSISGQGPGINCPPPPGDRFDGPQPGGYPGPLPPAKHSAPAENVGPSDPGYYGHYGNQVPGAPAQRYQPGYDPHFFGGTGQTPVPGYTGSQKIAAAAAAGPGVDAFSQQGHQGESSMMSHAMGPPHPPGPYPMQKNQVPGVMGGIPKGDSGYSVQDYPPASILNQSDAWMMSHQFGQNYPGQQYPPGHGMHPNASIGRSPYGMYPRFPMQGVQRYDPEKQRALGGPHHLSPSREIVFPPGSVEATRPKLTKRRKLTHKDMGSIDAWRLMMALRSGLITESTWALDVLTVLLRDDVTAPCLSLSHMPGLLEVLVEHFRHCLILIFGGEFEELEVSSEMQSKYAASISAVELKDGIDEDDLKVLPDAKMLASPGNYTLKTREGKSVGLKTDDDDEVLLDRKNWDVFKEFESSAFDWQMGRGDMTLHIITTLLSGGSHDFHKRRYFGKHYKNTVQKVAEGSAREEECKSTTSLSSNNTSSSDDKVTSQTDDAASRDTDNNCRTESTEGNPPSNLASPRASSSADGAAVEPNAKDSKNSASSDDKPSDLTGSVISMEFDNSDNNLFTCTQLESLKRSCSELDEETYRPNDGVSCRQIDSQLEISQRCLCLSNIFRNLSFIVGNDTEICKHNGLMLILGKLLLLHHQHLPRSAKLRASVSTKDAIDGASPPPPPEAECSTEDSADGNSLEWWWETLEGLRENTLVVFANICGQLDLSSFPEEICLPILNGLLHWLVCSSAEALDPLTTSGLSPQRLVLEALCKLCVTDSNIDLVLATPPFSRIVLLITNLAAMLSDRHQQVVREFAVGLLSCLVPGDSCIARALALQHPSVTLLLEFLEGAEQQAAQMVTMHGPVVLRDNPEIAGTSLDMLCRVATILRHLVDVPENVPLISRHQEKLLKLVMSPVLDRSVATILADVLSFCS